MCLSFTRARSTLLCRVRLKHYGLVMVLTLHKRALSPLHFSDVSYCLISANTFMPASWWRGKDFGQSPSFTTLWHYITWLRAAGRKALDHTMSTINVRQTSRCPLNVLTVVRCIKLFTIQNLNKNLNRIAASHFFVIFNQREYRPCRDVG